MTHTARGTFKVNLQTLPFEGAGKESILGRRSIDKQIEGDLVASTQGQMLSAMTPVQGSAAYVAIETVQGTLAGRHGSFVLHHTGVMNRGERSLSVKVVPDSGTGELSGIEGDFDIQITEGLHFYTFTYRFAADA
jgi:hypothetical protein